uniref:Uncharacterized protein n=1 Tax=Brassica oleracea TaxID=3712 RepID=A0A3P6G2J5_BRAOL|nr:unnamed protein product [Brassica oleracea]
MPFLTMKIPLRFQNLYFWNCDSITLPTAAVSVSNSEPGTVRSETLPCNIVTMKTLTSLIQQKPALKNEIPIQLCFHPFPTPKELELAGSLASGPISLLHICCVFGLSSGSPLCFVLSLSLFSMGKNFCLIYITRSGLCCSGEVCFRLGILCDKKKGGMLLALKLGSIFEDLQRMVVENFCFEKTDADLELSYLPIGLISTSAKDGNQNKVDIDLYKVPTESTTGEEERNFSNNGDDSRADNVSSDMHNEKKKGKMKQVGVDGDDYDADTIISEKENRENLSKSSLVEIVKKKYLFSTKQF